MAVTSNRSITVTYTGDVVATEIFTAGANGVSAGQMEVQNLANGANTITVPVAGSAVPTSVVVVPPSGNSTAITLKGVTGDTGVRLHNTDPSVIALHSSVVNFVLTAGAAITGVRFFWT